MQTSHKFIALLSVAAMIFMIGWTGYEEVNGAGKAPEEVQQEVHEVADLMRSKGYTEDCKVIKAASEMWWDAQAEIEAAAAAEAPQEMYLHQLENPDPDYHGHAVELTETQRIKVLRALIGEQGYGNTFEIYVGMLQYIMDHNDYGRVGKSYDNIGSRWMLSAASNRAWRYSVADMEACQTLMDAYDFVIVQGGRLFQRALVGYWDDDDVGIDSFAQNIAATCGGGHQHEWVDCVNASYTDEWVRYYCCIAKGGVA